MSKVFLSLATTPGAPLPGAIPFSGSRRFTLTNPVDNSVVQTVDSADLSVTFTGVPEVALVATAQSIGTDGSLFPDTASTAFSGAPVVIAPAVYDAPGALGVTVSAE